MGGESTAAGCGVDNHDDGFTGCLAREITARTQRPVQWQVVGQFGATARRIRYRLLPQLGEDLNVAVLLAGGNDVMSGRSPNQWRDDVSAIVDDLMERADHVVVAGIPPFALFPSMPTTLGRYLSERAAALDDVSRQICAVRPCTTWFTRPALDPDETAVRQVTRLGYRPTDVRHIVLTNPRYTSRPVWNKAHAAIRAQPKADLPARRPDHARRSAPGRGFPWGYGWWPRSESPLTYMPAITGELGLKGQQ